VVVVILSMVVGFVGSTVVVRMVVRVVNFGLGTSVTISVVGAMVVVATVVISGRIVVVVGASVMFDRGFRFQRVALTVVVVGRAVVMMVVFGAIVVVVTAMVVFTGSSFMVGASFTIVVVVVVVMGTLVVGIAVGWICVIGIGDLPVVVAGESTPMAAAVVNAIKPNKSRVPCIF